MSVVVTHQEIEQASDIRLFQGLTLEERTVLLKHSVVEDLSSKYMLFSQGDKADRFYIVLNGQVKLFTSNADGEENVLEVFSPVSSFAEAAMFASGRYPVNAETVEKSRIIRIDVEPFLNALEKDPELGMKMLRQMTRSYNNLRSQITLLKTQSPAQRLALFFLSLVAEKGDGNTVELPYDKHLIAARVGMRPESLSRTLAKLRKLGVENEKDTLTLKDPAALREFCKEK